jgi:hypothetical protein
VLGSWPTHRQETPPVRLLCAFSDLRKPKEIPLWPKFFSPTGPESTAFFDARFAVTGAAVSQFCSRVQTRRMSRQLFMPSQSMWPKGGKADLQNCESVHGDSQQPALRPLLRVIPTASLPHERHGVKRLLLLHGTTAQPVSGSLILGVLTEALWPSRWRGTRETLQRDAVGCGRRTVIIPKPDVLAASNGVCSRSMAAICGAIHQKATQEGGLRRLDRVAPVFPCRSCLPRP